MNDINNPCILILAHTPTVEKTDHLRNIIEKLKSYNYRICLATHTSTPQDIIDRCDYFLFDKQNELNYDPDLAYWIYHVLGNFEIRYKQYNSMSTHIVPIMKLVAGAMSYLKSLQVSKVCMIEYDIEIHNNEIFNVVFEDLNTHAVSTLYDEKLNNIDKYTLGIWGFDLREVDPTLVPVDSALLIDEYRKYFNANKLPATEHILYDRLWSNYRIKWNDYNLATKSLTMSLSDTNTGLGNHHGKNNYAFYVENEKLHFFCSNSSNQEWNFDIVVNNECISLNAKQGHWHIIPVKDMSMISTIKLFLNNNFVKEFTLTNEIDRDMIYKWSIFRKLND